MREDLALRRATILTRLITVLTMALAWLPAAAQNQLIVQPTFETGVGQLTPHTAFLYFGQEYAAVEYGARVDTPSAVATFTIASTYGSQTSASASEVVYTGLSLNQFRRVRLNMSLQTKNDFIGTLKITFFMRLPGATSDLAFRTVTVSVGEMPPPTMGYPVANENLGCAPAFQGLLTTAYPQNVIYQIEMTGPTNRTVTLPIQAAGTTFSFFTLETEGYQAGNYTWRVRTLDSRGRPGPWSSPRSNTLFGGLDMAGTASTSFLSTMRAAGWSTFFQAAWGGHGYWTSAATNLIKADQAGYKVAAYAFLNFDNGSTVSGAPANQTGQWQVDQGLKAIGFVTNKTSLPYDLKFFMVDIENVYQGTMSPDDRVQRIAEAVQRVRNLGFWPMIYTRNEGSNLWWNQYTNSSNDFRELWLWDSKPQLITHVYKDHLTMSNSSPWVSYGGWEVRGGKQFLLDQQVAGGRVDFNVWDPVVWNVNSPNPGAIAVVPANVSVVREVDNTYKVTLTLRNDGNIEAYAVRLGDAQLGTQSVTGRQTLGMITPTGSRMGVYSFPFAAGSPGTPAFLQFTIWTGDGPQNHSVWVTLP